MSLGEMENLRKRVREITIELLRLLGERNQLVERIGKIKEQLGVEVFQPEVEKELRDLMLREGRDLGLSPTLVEGLATVLFQASLNTQGKKGKSITHMDILRKGLELRRAGVEVHHLEVGEPDLGAPKEVRIAVSQAVVDGRARYGDPRGLPELRKKISEHVNSRFGCDLVPDNFLVVPGGRFGVYLALKALAGAGDEVILLDPSWPMYRQCVEFVGARPVGVKTRLENGWRPSIENLENMVNGSTKAIILNYPNNPTGKILDRKDFEEIVELASERKLTLISDEVYLDYSFGQQSSVLDGYDVRYVVIQSFSKSFGMTGYRVGYLIAEKELIAKMTSLISLMITCVPEFIQLGALRALDLENVPRKYSEIIRVRMETAARELSKLPVTFYRPDGGMYVFPKLNLDDVDITATTLKLLEKKGVAVAPGSIFGGYDSHFRISLGASEESITKGIRLMREFLSEEGLA
ncbi:MAG: aminotransferase class I/II-fold pyridoxal phosphate-dependent enzyme [Nitrososphaerota archaeon]